MLHAPFPETGSWYNPDQSGTGINIEVQNGILVGYYYGYTDEGMPEWQVVTGPLVRSEQEGLQWELETRLEYYRGGNCIGCDYQPPAEPTEGPAIKLEFQQRNYLRITIGDNPGQYYVPIIFGSLGMKYFEEQTPYVFPTFEGREVGHQYATHFVVVRKPNSDPPSPWLWETSIFPISVPRTHEDQVIYSSWIPSPGPDVIGAIIVCEPDQTSSEPSCKWVLGPREYVIPIGNLSDSRFFGEAEDGWTIEGYRIGYD